jgi:transcriptional regulator with XRE-family HTH domain
MDERFGERVRRLRTAKKLGLRATANEVGISPTFLSRIETSKEPAMPREEVSRKLALLLDDDFDVLMRLADRIATDVKVLLKDDPKMPEFLRMTREQNVSAEELIQMFKDRKGTDR